MKEASASVKAKEKVVTERKEKKRKERMVRFEKG